LYFYFLGYRGYLLNVPTGSNGFLSAWSHIVSGFYDR
jgi:hypothetical protein